MKETKFFSLGWQDFVKGLVVAVGTAFITAIIQTLEMGALPSVSQLKAAGVMALAAAAGYLLKNLFTNSQGQLFTTEPKQD